MDLTADFAFQPLPPIEPDTAAITPAAAGGSPLGPLANLSGSWSGSGFNLIWRPHHPGQDHFLELNVTTEELTFSPIGGSIPNRGLLQHDIVMHGLSYLQQIQDSNVIVNGAPAGLHFEPGLWLTVPATTAPREGSTVARLASIPHGTTILAQGTAKTTSGPPAIPDVSITPFSIGSPNQTIPFDESNLSKPSQFRTVGSSLSLLDFDHCGLADPASDAGTFLASLRQRSRRPLEQPFLDAYAGAVSDAAFPTRALWYESVALLRKALRAFARSPRSSVPDLLAAEGHECLGLTP